MVAAATHARLWRPRQRTRRGLYRERIELPFHSGTEGYAPQGGCMKTPQRAVVRALAVVLGASAVGAVSGMALTPTTPVVAACEKNECDDGWFWDDCSTAQTEI